MDDPHLCGNELATLVSTPLGPDNERVAFVVPEDRLFARPDYLDRPIDPSLLKSPGSQRQHNLDRHVLPTAKGPTDRGVLDSHFVNRKSQSVGDFLLIFVGPLASDLDGDAAFIVNVGQAGFRLQISMLLSRGQIFAFDNHFGRLEARLQIPMSNSYPVEDIALPVWLKLRRIVEHRCLGVGDYRKIFIFDFDKLGRLSGDLFGLRNDEGDLVADKAHPIGVGLGRVGAAQYRLIVNEHPVLVDRDVFGGEHTQHTPYGLGGGCVNAVDYCVGSACEENLHIGLIGHVDVAREERLPSDFAECIDTRYGIADHVCFLRLFRD